MKAIVYERYGPPEVLRLKEVPSPRPRDDEVLIEVRATTATSGDARLRAMNLPAGFGLMGRLAFGVFAPRRRILGVELSGVIVAIGKQVTRWQVGDARLRHCRRHHEVLRRAARATRRRRHRQKAGEPDVRGGGGAVVWRDTALDFFRRGKLAKGSGSSSTALRAPSGPPPSRSPNTSGRT